MNNQEAIEAIKSNYPTSGYEMLKEALNMAINALEQQGKERWHVVADGDLPKGSGSYIVIQATHSLKEYDKILRLDTVLADFSSRKWKRAKHLEVIAWKELPEAYKPEEGK